MPDFGALRERMVAQQIAGRGLVGAALLGAFREVPRELFVAPDLAGEAYEDRPLPIEAGQTISQPYIVAFMIDAARVRPGQRVLEIGAGSGYAAAILGRIAAEVVAIERHGELARLAAERMERLGYDNVRIVEGDGTLGFAAGAPYDAILAAAAGRDVPEALLDQLADGGVLVMPVGAPGGAQRLVRVRRRGERFDREELEAVRFVPLIGEQGWPEQRS
ncbi:protein-L-isoaspartate(D-aspartate) O-methyltransferase [Sphingosinicella sp. YJ22]|uniref:protein-L-isoaspartate(D-aspartate) O-methyltransferase n=1 Tax=Sphingosinicella sp. YJ22 TaxID=1104780 RepID=UPI001FB01726|nr:protein-L-isoaspartate(D-aspartate) O-methyltransferase [Sphingosinicella sp. YJ22]